MRENIKVLFVSAEITPYASVGGLGEVSASLPEEMNKTAEFSIQRIMPLYKDSNVITKYLMDFPVKIGEEYDTCILKTTATSSDVKTYFISNDRYFYRESIYNQDDDWKRFFFFCKAVLEFLKHTKVLPDIIHLNDWHTGFLALLINKEFPDIKILYTIHNINYQGFIPHDYVKELLSEQELHELGYPSWLNAMQAGIIYADKVNTVSPTYAKEVMNFTMNQSVNESISQREDDIVGIINGINFDIYNPSEDSAIPFLYDADRLDNKRKNKAFIREKYNLPNIDVPLISMITRLVPAKGIDILLKALQKVNIENMQLLILGTGNNYYQGILKEIETTFPLNIVVNFEYSPELARLIYAASDIYLMPSMYEPCGLGQLYAMRYGAVPVVNPVGGLKDTVLDYYSTENKFNGTIGTGFHMDEWSGRGLSKAMDNAIDAFYTEGFNKAIINNLKYDSSWGKSIKQYQKLYLELISKED